MCVFGVCSPKRRLRSTSNHSARCRHCGVACSIVVDRCCDCSCIAMTLERVSWKVQLDRWDKLRPSTIGRQRYWYWTEVPIKLAAELENHWQNSQTVFYLRHTEKGRINDYSLKSVVVYKYDFDGRQMTQQNMFLGTVRALRRSVASPFLPDQFSVQHGTIRPLE